MHERANGAGACAAEADQAILIFRLRAKIIKYHLYIINILLFV